MAIQFARIEIVSRSKGGSACCKGAYNARSQIKDNKTGVTYNFSNRGDNVYHTISLPEGAVQKFKDTNILMNEVERSENRVDSQLLKDVVLALPDDRELSLKDRIEITHRLIEKREWVKKGLAVQIDIHQPHDGEKNWHAHLLVTTRRFKGDGLSLAATKATDLNPEIRKNRGKVYVIPEAQQIHEDLKEVINNYFRELGLSNRVDEISTVPREHIGPVRMRNSLNAAFERNEVRAIAHLENMKDGDSVLDRITTTQSIFSVEDLVRAVQDIPDPSVRDRLVAEALASERLVHLYPAMVGQEVIEEAVPTKYFTTKEVRAEEERIIRIISSINQRGNVSKSLPLTLAIKIQSKISDTQRAALKELLVGEGGIRCLRGRAGTGKSYVLGIANKLATSYGQRVIGLTPTNKATSVLKAEGFRETFTIKGFLFALKNGRATLRSGDLIIVDEAGMIANLDLQELVKAVHSYKANLILAGDERQLTSVERGGLFEIITDRFGSYELSDIRRQKEEWARKMATDFANGYIVQGLDLLRRNKGIHVSDSLENSRRDLINKWQRSPFAIDQRLIITVTNRDVDALNAGVREVLKAEKSLKGPAVVIEAKEKRGDQSIDTKREFMAGDRVVFAAANRRVGIKNGEFGTIIKVTSGNFTVQLDGTESRLVKFNPAIIQGLKHGYAVTTYKSQGSSIADVYNLHSGVGNSRSTYVNLTRHVNEVRLFCNVQDTKNLGTLMAQLSKINDNHSSLNFITDEDIQELQTHSSWSVLSKAGKWLKERVTAVEDMMHSSPEYYKYEAPKVSRARAKKVLTGTYEQLTLRKEEVRVVSGSQELSRGIVTAPIEKETAMEAVTQVQTRIAVNAGRGQGTRFKTAQERFYERVDNMDKSANQERPNRDYREEMEGLRREIKLRAESIIVKLLGQPNKRLSEGDVYRYGENGGLTVTIRGDKAGSWQDSDLKASGDMISLVERRTAQNFKGAVGWLRDAVKEAQQANLGLSYEDGVSRFYDSGATQAERDQAKFERQAKRTAELHSKSKEIHEKSVANRYLEKEAGITCWPGDDVRTAGVWNKETAKNYPALIAFARDNFGEVTGGQMLLLDPETSDIAKVELAKKSFGKISGSFVHLQTSGKASEGDNSNVTIIAEGLENALSIRQTYADAKILCSLSLGNLKTYHPKEGEKIIIAAGNYGDNPRTSEALETARTVLKEVGAKVHILSPKEEGSFNELFKTRGVAGIQEIIEPSIRELTEEDKSLQQEQQKSEPLKTKTKEKDHGDRELDR